MTVDWPMLPADPSPMLSWMDDAVCVSTDPDAFFPEVGQPTVAAQRVCAECPVRVQCLEFALKQRIDQGVWGGLSARDRAKLPRSARRAS